MAGDDAARIERGLVREYADDPCAAGLPPLTVDRQRVVHASAFRRLQHKTQVFVAVRSDHYRTRMTHTLEVAHLARTLARRLDLDAELAELAALAHDLGHPPFGHAGERALDECMKDSGGFEHNVHALRVVEYLEHPYPEFRGLNLTRVLRECLAKHTTRYDEPGSHPLQDGRPPPLAGQVAALADRLAYGLHDLQDGVYAGLIDPASLGDLRIVGEAGAPAATKETRETTAAGLRRLRPLADSLERFLVEDCARAMRDKAAATASGGGGAELVRLTDATDAGLCELEALLRGRVYRSSQLARMDSKARRIVIALFDAYVSEPALLPERFRRRVDAQGPQRVATDYIAGMTDRFCLQEHARLFDPQMDV